MYELIHVKGNTYYIDCPAKIGVYVTTENKAFLIDSGSDKEAGKKLLRRLEEQGWSAEAILNTHSNSDHIGGNKLLQDRLGVPCYAPEIEDAFTKHTILEPSFLYGGYPCKDLRNKFLMAEAAPVRPLSEADLPSGFSFFPLPGHFFNMVGFRTPDDVVFAADCLFGEEILNKYHVTFVYDVAGYLETLDRISSMDADWFVPAHGPACGDIRPLAVVNRKKVEQIAADLLEICRTPSGFDQVLARLFDRYQLTMNFNQQVLVGSTIRSYLSYLIDTGRMAVTFQDNILCYQAL
ncbi:MAG TPA: MBL fold metallo-hydrolase [Clostridiales bacterium]|nr:MBL fold metallo-hydrolase [Clostridiales bacterium]